jgi:hypothetical protein
MTTTPTPTVEEAKQLLEEAKHREAERAKQAERDRREHERAVAAFEKSEEGRVSELEARVKAALATGVDTTVPALGVRRVARAYLRGSLAPGELMRPEHHVAQADAAAAQAYGLAVEAAGQMERLTDPDLAGMLGADDPLVRRADACEVACWRAFAQRVEVMAGEARP